MANITKLSNGITVVSQELQGYASVSLGVWAPVGSRYENIEQSGISHFIEHMAFKGTTTRSTQQVVEDIENVGGDLNAWTSRDATAWYVKLLAEDMPLGVEILGDILINPSFEQEELEREREVVLQEIAQSQDFPDDVLFDQFQEACYENQPISYPILGTVENVSSFTQDNVYSWLRDMHMSSKLVIAASGKVDHNALVLQAEKYFGNLPEVGTHSHKEAKWSGVSRLIGRDLEQIQFVIGLQGYDYHHEDWYAASVFSVLLGGGMSSRLFQEIREKRGLVYGIGAFHSSLVDSGCFGIHGACTSENIQKVLKLSAQELMKCLTELSDDEINRAKAQLKAALLMSQEKASQRAEQLARQMMIFGKVLNMDDLQQRVLQVNKSHLITFVEHILAQDVAFAAIGKKEHLPTKEQFTDYLK